MKFNTLQFLSLMIFAMLSINASAKIVTVNSSYASNLHHSHRPGTVERKFSNIAPFPDTFYDTFGTYQGSRYNYSYDVDVIRSSTGYGTYRYSHYITTDLSYAPFEHQLRNMFREESNSGITNNLTWNSTVDLGLFAENGVNITHRFGSTTNGLPYDYTGYVGGVYSVRINESVEHDFEIIDGSILDEASAWLDNMTSITPTSIIREIVSGQSEHVRSSFVKPVTVGGVRGESAIDSSLINFIGNQIFTNSPGWATYSLELPDTQTLSVPLSFGENKDDATLDIYLNDVLMDSLSGVDFETDAMEIVAFDITGLEGTSAELRFVLDTVGTQQATLFLPDSIITGVEVSSVPVPSAVWLFGSGLIGLIGVARRKKA